jgi:demethylmenaquinone methyltransferase/2-methoxy-6-polyprenyl-1,4-benzoquinol methylase
MVRDRVSAILPGQADKPRYVAAMFGRIARRYDLMNTLMTGGRDAAWRRAAAEAALAVRGGAPTGIRVLDVGTGTGRLAEAVVDLVPTARVVGIDFSPGMLRLASRRLELAGADALRLPFADDQFDAVVSAFVVRNLADVSAGLAEQMRVLRRGGWLAVLETTPGPGGVLQPAYQVYFRYVVPLLGRLIAGDPAAYAYLPTSTLAFLKPTHLADMLRHLGLVDVVVRRLALGCVAITCGSKPSVMLAATGRTACGT